MGAYTSSLSGVTQFHTAPSLLDDYRSCTAARLNDALANFRAAGLAEHLTLADFDLVFGPAIGDCTKHFHALLKPDESAVDARLAFTLMSTLATACSPSDVAGLVYDVNFACHCKRHPTSRSLPLGAVVSLLSLAVRGVRLVAGVPEFPRKDLQRLEKDLLAAVVDPKGFIARRDFVDWVSETPMVTAYLTALRAMMAAAGAHREGLVDGGKLFDKGEAHLQPLAATRAETALDAPVKAMQKDTRLWVPLPTVRASESVAAAVRVLVGAPVDVVAVDTLGLAAARHTDTLDSMGLLESFIHAALSSVCRCRQTSRRKSPTRGTICALHNRSRAPDVTSSARLETQLDNCGRLWSSLTVGDFLRPSRRPPVARRASQAASAADDAGVAGDGRRRATMAAASLPASSRLSMSSRRGSKLVVPVHRQQHAVILPVFFDQPILCAASLIAGGVKNLGVVTDNHLSVGRTVSVVEPVTILRYVSERQPSTLGRSGFMSVADARLGANQPVHTFPASMPAILCLQQFVELPQPRVAVMVDDVGNSLGLLTTSTMLHMLNDVLPARSSFLLRPIEAWDVGKLHVAALTDSVGSLVCQLSDGAPCVLVSNEVTGRLVGAVTPLDAVRFICEVFDEVVADKLAALAQSEQ